MRLFPRFPLFPGHGRLPLAAVLAAAGFVLGTAVAGSARAAGPAAPDLAVTRLGAKASGGVVRFAAVVTNEGDSPTPPGVPVRVRFDVSGVPLTVRAAHPGGLAPGATTTFAAGAKLSSLYAGAKLPDGSPLRVTATVDPEDLVTAEADETDNARSGTVTPAGRGALAAGPSRAAANLIFSDEFSGAALDARRWSRCFYWVKDGATCDHTSTGEVQLFRPQNVTVGGGTAKLTAKRERISNYPYTSGMIASHGKGVFTYGYTEFRVKTARRKGLWLTLWLQPQDGSWPPEIDILEHLGNYPNLAFMTYHWTPKDQRTTNWKGPDFTAGFNTFGVDWSPKKLVWYVNGVERFRVEGPQVTAKPHYVMATLAVGGWPGLPDAGAVFPDQVELDYVRVYKNAWTKVSKAP